VRFHKRRQDVREQRIADDDEDEVHGDDDQEPPIAGDLAKSSFTGAGVRPRANEATRCSGVIRVMSNVWFAVRVTPTPAPPMTAQANACHGRSTNAKPA